MICPHCGGAVKTTIERWRRSRVVRRICLDCPNRVTDGPFQRCAPCRELKNRKRRKREAT
jgi:hypothetical protein